MGDTIMIFCFIFGAAFALIDPGDRSIEQLIPEKLVADGGECTLADQFGFPDCIKRKTFDGKIYFLLSEYSYARSRAMDACNALGGHLAVPITGEEHTNIQS